MATTLTPGAVATFARGEELSNAVVQLLDIKEIGNTKRYKGVISDGEHSIPAGLAQQLGSLVQEGQLVPFAVIKVTDVALNTTQGKKAVVILNCEVVGQAPGKIGDPRLIDDDAAAPAKPAVASTPQAKKTQSSAAAAVGSGAKSPPPFLSSSSSGPGSGQKKLAAENYHPISSLNPYNSRWTIKARVTAKSEMKQWSNERGSGQLFSVDLLDAHGGQIRATMFKDAAEKWFPVLQVNKVYTISKGTLKVANRRFSTLNSDYELTLGTDAEIRQVEDDQNIGQQSYNFVKLDKLNDVNTDSFVDVIGVVTRYDEKPSRFVASRTKRDMTKRTITLVDDTCVSIELTIWGEPAEKFGADHFSDFPVLAVKACRVSEFQGRSLNTTFGSTFAFNPDIPEAHALRGWFDSVGRDKAGSFQTLTQRSASQGVSVGGGSVRKNWAAVKEERIGLDGDRKNEYFTLLGTVMHISSNWEKANLWYLACPGERDGKPCNRKVTPSQTGTYHCEACNRSYDHAMHRYILSVLVSDSTGGNWVTLFDDQAVRLMGGVKAADVAEIKANGTRQQWDAVFKGRLFTTWTFRLRAQQQMQNDEQRLRFNVLALEPPNYARESAILIEEIDRYL